MASAAAVKSTVKREDHKEEQKSHSTDAFTISENSAFNRVTRQKLKTKSKADVATITESPTTAVEDEKRTIKPNVLKGEDEGFTLADLLTSWVQSFACAICLERVRDPVALSCLHSFCRSCIVMLLNTKSCKSVSISDVR